MKTVGILFLIFIIPFLTALGVLKFTDHHLTKE